MLNYVNYVVPSSVQELTDTTAFKHQLKTVLFQRCYSSSN